MCLGYISETTRSRKLTLGRDISCDGEGGGGLTLTFTTLSGLYRGKPEGIECCGFVGMESVGMQRLSVTFDLGFVRMFSTLRHISPITKLNWLLLLISICTYILCLKIKFCIMLVIFTVILKFVLGTLVKLLQISQH